jgi:hypothetical protein
MSQTYRNNDYAIYSVSYNKERDSLLVYFCDIYDERYIEYTENEYLSFVINGFTSNLVNNVLDSGDGHPNTSKEFSDALLGFLKKNLKFIRGLDKSFIEEYEKVLTMRYLADL